MSGYITNKNNKKKCDSKLITAGNGVQNTPSPRPERPEQATNVLNKMECKEACCSLIRDIIILETQGQIVGARESRNGREKKFWHQSEARMAATVWNWSGKTLSPGAFLAVLYFSPCHIFPPV